MQCKTLAQILLQIKFFTHFGWEGKKKGGGGTITHKHTAVQVHRMSILSALALVHSYKTRKCPRLQYEQMFHTQTQSWPMADAQQYLAGSHSSQASTGPFAAKALPPTPVFSTEKTLVNNHEPVLPPQMSHGR